ncbi:MAG: BsuPI-related putative proteinase inhibitor [Armatimonadota bacterium]
MKLFFTVIAAAVIAAPAFPRDSMLPDFGKPGILHVTRIASVTTVESTVPVQPVSGVRTDKQSYSLGEAVRITFVVENTTQQDIVFRFPSGQIYDIWVEKDNKEVWRWSRGKFFTQALTSITLKPGEKRTFEVTWNQTSNDGQQVSPGAYSIFAQLTTMQPRPTPVMAQITVGSGRAIVKTMTVGSIVNNIDAAVGQTVQLSGTYLGWRPDPNSPSCKQGPPVNRSDWAISDQTGCIYVTGQSGLDPTDDYGKSIAITGIVRKTQKGQPYIEVKTVILNQP